MFRDCFLALTITLVTSSAVTSQSSALHEQLATRCEEFELARAALDITVLEALVADNASAFLADGRGSVSLLGHLRRAKLRSTSNGTTDSMRILHRDIHLDAPAALVTELIGASVDVEPGRKVKPRRRTTTWVQKQGRWKIVGVHESLYSRWESAIEQIEQQDAASPPEPGGVVFVGSSSIRGWKTLAVDFPGVNALVITQVLIGHIAPARRIPSRSVCSFW